MVMEGHLHIKSFLESGEEGASLFGDAAGKRLERRVRFFSGIVSADPFLDVG